MSFYRPLPEKIVNYCSGNDLVLRTCFSWDSEVLLWKGIIRKPCLRQSCGASHPPRGKQVAGAERNGQHFYLKSMGKQPKEKNPRRQTKDYSPLKWYNKGNNLPLLAGAYSALNFKGTECLLWNN